MPSKVITYKADNEINTIRYLKVIDKNLIKDIEQLKSDKKIFFIYDKEISNKFINEIKITLKLTGNIVYFKEIEGKRDLIQMSTEFDFRCTSHTRCWHCESRLDVPIANHD